MGRCAGKELLRSSILHISVLALHNFCSDRSHGGMWFVDHLDLRGLSGDKNELSGFGSEVCWMRDGGLRVLRCWLAVSVYGKVGQIGWCVGG